MGMYDYFICDTSCPICGNYLIEPYQTKDLDRIMDSYKPGDKVCIEGSIRVYTHCRHEIYITSFDEGGAFYTNNKAIWIEYKIPIIDGKISKNQNLWKLQKMKEVDFNGISFIPDTMTKEEIVLHYLKFNGKMRKDIEITTIERRKYL